MDFHDSEKKWQEEWYGKKAFEPQSTPGAKKFFFTVPYPYVSGSLHVGHGRTYSVGDVMARFKRMQGFNVLWPMGFHITGTPVLAVTQRIASGDVEAINMYKAYVSAYEKDEKKVMEIVESFGIDPWNVVRYFSKKLVDDFKKLGVSIDFSRQFTTGDKEYNKFIEWQFQKYRQKGLLSQGHYPILYCVNDGNAVGEDDIKDGDSNPVEVQKFTALKSKCKDFYLLSSTLRPETYPGITNLFVNPDADYAEVEMNGEKIVVSKTAVNKLILQGKKATIKREFKGKELIGLEAEAANGMLVPILPASFVDPENASGIVHSVPAHAPFDFVALQDLLKNKDFEKTVKEIKLVSLISVAGFGEFPAKELAERMKIANTREKQKLDKATQELYKKEYYEGRMHSGPFAGKSVIEAKDLSAKKLLDEGKAIEFFEASRKANCRCGGQVVAAVLQDQWFIDFNAGGWKEKAKEALSNMTIYPNAYRKQFEDVFAWLDKRPCARRRGLGTLLPFANEWTIESLSDSTIYMAFYTIIKSIREEGLTPEELDEKFFDNVFLGKGKGTKSMEKIRKEFLYWYPNDQRHTGIAHVTNHLSFFIFSHTAIFDKAQWPKSITLNELVLSEGAKMSKSKGNVVSLHDIFRDYGADLFRLYAVSSSELGATLDFRKKEVETTKKSLNKFTYIIEDLAGKKDAGKPTPAGEWLYSKFNSNLADATIALEEFRLRDYVQLAFYKNLQAFEHFSNRASHDEKSLAASLAKKWVLLLTPVIPHLAEELWQKLGGKTLASFEKWPEAEKDKINPQAEEAEDLVMQVSTDLRNIRALVRITPKKVKVITCSKAKRLAVEKAFSAGSIEEAKEKTGAENAVFVEKNYYQFKGKSFLANEQTVLDSATEFLGRQCGVAVEVETEEKSASAKAAKAMPGKPAIEFV